MPHLDANGLRFHVQRLPDEHPPDSAARPQVVMVHGLVMDNLGSYYFTIANPVALEADVHLYDLRGHGRTSVPATGYRVVDHVDDLRALMEAWGLERRPVHLVGNSFGGVIALAYAHRHPEHVASLVLLEAHFATEGWAEHMAGSLALAAFGLDEDRVQDWLDEHGTRKLKRMARDAEHLFERTSMIDDLQREQPFPHHALRAIRCPVLAIYGEHSDILDRARDLDEHVPRCELHIVPDVAHSVLSEKTPFVRRQTVAWLRRTHRRAAHPAAATAVPVES